MQTPDKRDTSASAADMLEQLRTTAAHYFHGVGEDQRIAATAIPYLSFIRIAQTTEMTRGILEPSLCLVLQGTKKILIGTHITTYGVGNYVLSATDMPVAGQVVEASPETPYLGLKIALDPKLITALILDLKLPVPQAAKGKRHADSTHAPAASAGAWVESAEPELQDAFLRLVRLLAKPRDIPALAGLLQQEILYRLLTAKGGDIFYQTVVAHANEKGVNKAISWIKDHYAQPIKIEDLAKQASMSASVLHRRFKAITVMSPLQYQKQLRLLEARRLLLGGDLEAATAAFHVGYQSPSQFSREYRRLFGVSPLRDIEHLRRNGTAPDIEPA